MSRNEELLASVVGFYIKSSDFNGLPIYRLQGDRDDILDSIASLVRSEKVSVNFGDIHGNPHILAFEPHDVETQLSMLRKRNLSHACLYPTRSVLQQTLPDNDLKDRPFERELRLGEPQLSLRFFDLSILETYRNDPRYYYDVTDINGHIGLRSDYYDSPDVRAEDRTFLKTLGFGYSKDTRIRVVVVFLRYLSDMVPEHQQLWHTKGLRGDYFAHPEYIRMSSGRFAERTPIFLAFVEELRQVNRLSELMGRSPLFRKDYCDDDRPKHFGFLVRPTSREYSDFVHLLDKMISENIDQKFFEADVDFEKEVVETDGRIRRVHKGSITILEDWLQRCFELGGC